MVLFQLLKNKKCITTSIDLMYQFLTTLGIPCFIHGETEAPNRGCNLPNNHFTQGRCPTSNHISSGPLHCFQCLSEDPLYTMRSASFSRKLSNGQSYPYNIKTHCALSSLRDFHSFKGDYDAMFFTPSATQRTCTLLQPSMNIS